MFLPLKVWYFFCIPKFTYFSQLEKVLNGLWQWKDSDMSAPFFKEILYISTNNFFSLCCPHRSTRRHLTTMMTVNVIQTKKKKKERKKEKKSQLWTIPLVKLKNQTPWSKLVLMTTVHSRYLCRVFTVHQEREARRPVSYNQPKIFLICLC